MPDHRHLSGGFSMSMDKRIDGKRWLSAVVCIGIVISGLAVGTGTGSGNTGDVFAAHGDDKDFAPPEIVSIERVSAREIYVVMDDNHEIDTSTIDASDFEVDPATIESVSTESEPGTRVGIDIVLQKGVGMQAVTVSSVKETDIADDSGNEFDPSKTYSEIVSAPESSRPELHSAKWANGSVVQEYEGNITWSEDNPGERTSVELLLTDDQGIDESSISAVDFVVNRSSINKIATREAGSNLSVLLVLEDVTDERGVKVGLAEGADIRDVDGDEYGNPIKPPAQDFVVHPFNSGPRLHSGTRVNDTAVRLTFVDGKDMAESSFQRHDFQIAGSDVRGIDVSDFGGGDIDSRTLREYDIAGVTATEMGKNSSVTLRLERPVDDDELLVRIRDEAIISNRDGQTLDPTDDDVKTHVFIHGMDGVGPKIEDYSATGSGNITLSLTPSERLAGINLTVENEKGKKTSVDRSNFAFRESEFVYEMIYIPATSGNQTFRLNTITDRSGNTRAVDRVVSVNGTDVEPGPTPVIAVDFAASEHRTLVFDARHSTGAVSNYTWTFDDSETRTGMRVTREFDPGSHQVTLSATGPDGLTGTDTATFNLTSGMERLSPARFDGVRRVTNPELEVVKPGDGVADTTLVEVRNPSPGVPVSTARTDGQPLAATGDISVDSVDIVPDRYEGFSLGLSASGPSAVADAGSATDTEPVGGFTVAHDVPDSDFVRAQVTTSVDANRLEELGASRDDITVLRQNGGSWERLPTAAVGVSDRDGDTVYQFTAGSPGFSRFAIVVDRPETERDADSESGTSQTDSAEQAQTEESDSETQTETESSVVILSATLSETNVAPGDTVLVNATVANRGDANVVHTVGLSVNGTVVATESVTLPAGQRQNVTLRYEANETGELPVAVNDTTAGTLTVSDGGMLASLFGIVGSIVGLFGFLPLGLLKPLVMFVGLPILVVFLALKGLALYLGY